MDIWFFTTSPHSVVSISSENATGLVTYTHHVKRAYITDLLQIQTIEKDQLSLRHFGSIVCICSVKKKPIESLCLGREMKNAIEKWIFIERSMKGLSSGLVKYYRYQLNYFVLLLRWLQFFVSFTIFQLFGPKILFLECIRHLTRKKICRKSKYLRTQRSYNHWCFMDSVATIKICKNLGLSIVL